MLLVITYELVAHSHTGDLPGDVLRRAAGRGPDLVPRAVGLPGGPGEVLSAPGPPPNTPIGLKAYAGRVKQTFRRLTAAQKAQLDKVVGDR